MVSDASEASIPVAYEVVVIVRGIHIVLRKDMPNILTASSMPVTATPPMSTPLPHDCDPSQ